MKDHQPEDVGGDVALVVWRMRRFIIAMGLVGFIGGIFLAIGSTQSYRASATLFLTEDTPVGGVLGELSALTAAPPAKAEMEVLRSRGIMEDAYDNAAGIGINLATRLDDLDTYSPGRSLWRWASGAPGPKSRFHVEVLDWPKTAPRSLYLTVRANELEISQPGLFGFNWPFDGDASPFVSGEPVEWEGIRFILSANIPVEAERHLLLQHTARNQIIPDMVMRASVREISRGSGVVQINFEDTDPGRAAIVVNHMVDAYITRSRERTAKRAGKTIEYVEAQLERVQTDLVAAESKLVEFRSTSGAISLTDEVLVLISKASDLELEKVQLVHSIEEKEIALNWARESNGSGVATLASAPEGAFDPVAQAILTSLGEVQAEKVRQGTEWLPDSQLMRGLQEQIDRLTADFITHLEGRLEGERLRLLSTESILASFQSRLAGLPETERELAQLTREAKSLEGIYTFLLKQLEEARIAEASAVAAVEVIDRALPPTERFKPQLRMFGGVGFMFGIMAAIGLSLLRSSRGLLVGTAAGLETYSNLTVFASIPDFRRGATKSRGAKGKYYLPVRDSPDSPTAHAYRALRAALKFAQKGRKLSTMTITSSVQGEGKSTTILDLALSLANSGSKVLVVDADLRRPVVHKYFDMERAPGLADVLAEDLPLADAIRPTDKENLSLMTCGKAHDHPGELLALPAMLEVVNQAGEDYDYVLFDVPPVLAVADASGFLSELDGIFMLTRANAVPGAVIESAADRLRLSGGNLVGAILNGIKTSRFGGYGGYGGYGYGYGYTYSSSYRYTEDNDSKSTKA